MDSALETTRVRIFITGASGFIGRALVAALCGRGHQIVAAARSPHRQILPSPRVESANVDFTNAIDAAAWRPLIIGADAVVNAVGILREAGAQTFARIHVEAPRALFAACALERIGRVVQLSALGADALATTPYHRSKRDGDAALLEAIPSGICVQPSLVYGHGGASARWFTMLASLPVVPLPVRGDQSVQPIHIDDLIEALCRLIEDGWSGPRRVPLVGPEPKTLRTFLSELRAALRLGPARFVSIPAPLVRIAARVGDLTPSLLFDSDTWAMLRRGNTADVTAITTLLGHPPRPVSAFVAPNKARTIRIEAQLGWLLPVLRVSIAFVWIMTGIVSFGVYPVEDSYALLARAGVSRTLAPLLLYGAALLDIALGVLVFALRGHARRWLWRAQMALIVGYTIIISWALPEYWLHPYGPVTKNIPLLAMLWLLDTLEDRDERNLGKTATAHGDGAQ